MQEFNEKQIQILQIAEKEFASYGFDGTSIRQISKLANVNVAMVSYYFGSKERLLESLILYRTKDLKMILENLFQENYSPIEKIEKFINYYIEKIDSNRDFHHILLFEISSNKRAMDFDSFSEIKKANFISLNKIITEGQNANLFKKNINTELIMATILGTYFYFQMNRPFYKDLLNLETELDYNNYIKNELTNHIQLTIKSLLHEN
jgi:AcrR family transcriptional regulator